MILDGLRSLGAQQLRASIIGSERLERAEMASPLDPGWFGPSSVAWRVHGDSSTLVGGLSALLTQTLHPLAMAGVSDHSDYRHDPWGRLNRTGRFIGATTFGSTETAEMACATVRAVHGLVEGHAPDGTPYRANDPHLLGWVHCTEIDAFCRAYQRYGSGALRRDERDRYVAEMSRVGMALGATDLPMTWTELQDRLVRYGTECQQGDQAAEATSFLLNPPMHSATKAMYRVLSAGAIDLMPSWARAMAQLPAPSPLDVVAIRPATLALSRTLGWFLSDPSEESIHPQHRTQP